ncbi:adenosylcobinamide-phosphate synthase CbiB [Desulfogranum japonicum]|uniref:adenosylcobinamide-phosphate synthase CbiB n=1 Tax=Desulfogranum japonicum TaxID=231447 RepID=UPI00041DFE29|nr:adenosylcobinamide-phosphate synthase CbiB [Desulfogranum japonicum]
MEWQLWLTSIIIPLGFLLDRLIGDPLWLPHPIRWMGNAIMWSEPRFRRYISRELLAGGCFALFLIFSCWLLCFLALKIAATISPLLALVLEIVMVFYCLSIQSLKQAAMDIYKELQRGDTDQAREQVAMIVGRDVQSYQGKDIARATVETVAENFVDGVVSPLFYAALGGGPLMLTYKMVNTLDSMVGYKNDKYLYFGRAAAKIDDLANWIPARLSVGIIALAAAIPPFTTSGRAWKLALQEGREHASPNAGYPEAAFAGALGVRLNGPNYYGGILVEKPYIGRQFEPPKVEHIELACNLMVRSAQLAVFLAWVVCLILLFCKLL